MRPARGGQRGEREEVVGGGSDVQVLSRVECELEDELRVHRGDGGDLGADRKLRLVGGRVEARLVEESRADAVQQALLGVADFSQAPVGDRCRSGSHVDDDEISTCSV